MSTLKRLHRQARTRRQGKPAFTLLELIVVLLVLGILAAIAVPTFNRVKENSVERAAQTTLEAIDRNGEAIASSDPGLSDAAVAAAALAEVSAPEGMTITRNTSGDGKEVTVEYTNGGIVASGKVAFADGVGTITPAAVSGGSSSTTSTTAAPTTTTTVAPTTTTTVAAPVYNVGDTGPGGGIVFAVFATPFACGPTLASTCTYLEVAPDGWNGTSTDPNRAWSGNTSTLVGTNTDLGYGYQNTLAAVAQDSTANRAVTLADSYSNNGKDDWFLPSLVELRELCKYARQQPTGDTSVSCSGGTLRSGYAMDSYWSSSENSASAAWFKSFIGGMDETGVFKVWSGSGPKVRPIRAF